MCRRNRCSFFSFYIIFPFDIAFSEQCKRGWLPQSDCCHCEAEPKNLPILALLPCCLPPTFVFFLFLIFSKKMLAFAIGLCYNASVILDISRFCGT